MPITLRHHPLSPSVSPVLLTLRALGMEERVVKEEVDLTAVRRCHPTRLE